jgi:hypothetical protein
MLPLDNTMLGEPPYGELDRPQFHFSAIRNWMNDPNGLVFYDGEYHLFLSAEGSGMRLRSLLIRELSSAWIR